MNMVECLRLAGERGFPEDGLLRIAAAVDTNDFEYPFADFVARGAGAALFDDLQASRPSV